MSATLKSSISLIFEGDTCLHKGLHWPFRTLVYDLTVLVLADNMHFYYLNMQELFS